MRRVLNRWFAPAAVRRLEPLVLSRCVELIEELRPKGGCDLVSEFAIRFPTDLFLATLNLPLSDGDAFLHHVENVFKAFAGRELKAAAASTEWIRGYFDRAIAEREAAPRDTEVDFISRLLVAELDGGPIPRDDIITICYTRDARRAGHHAQRARLHLPPPGRRPRTCAIGSPPSRNCGPGRWRSSSGFTRWSTWTAAWSRRTSISTACRCAGATSLWLGLATANHDPKKFADPRGFDIDREHLNHHLAFGAGPHRCIGMHLARHELVIALTEWHKRIPDYELATDDQLYERGAQLSIDRLPLRWEV